MTDGCVNIAAAIKESGDSVGSTSANGGLVKAVSPSGVGGEIGEEEVEIGRVGGVWGAQRRGRVLASVGYESWCCCFNFMEKQTQLNNKENKR